MFEKIRKLKDRKGFTLVELIVVLVILAILAALLIPALTGYIDKANKEKVVAETRSWLPWRHRPLLVRLMVRASLPPPMLIRLLPMTILQSWPKPMIVGLSKYMSAKQMVRLARLRLFMLWDGTYGCLYIDGAYYVKG